MSSAMIIIIIAAIFAFVAFLCIITGIILIETKYTVSPYPWFVHVLIWAGVIVFVIALIVIGFLAVSVRREKQKKGECDDEEGCEEESVKKVKKTKKSKFEYVHQEQRPIEVKKVESEYY